MNYQKQALDFAKKHNIKLTIVSLRYGKHFDSDKDSRYIFKCKLSKGRKSFTFDFGQSIMSGEEEPTMYDILSCLQKYEVGTFENFCDNFGYDIDSRTAEKTYKAVCKEYNNLERVFGADILEQMQEIQ